MKYQIALSPELGLTPTDFVEAWNASEEAQTLAEAQLTSSNESSYNPLVDVTIATLTTLGSGIVTNALYDLIKQVVTKKTPHKHTHITQVKQPDGTHILVVDIKEE